MRQALTDSHVEYLKISLYDNIYALDNWAISNKPYGPNGESNCAVINIRINKNNSSYAAPNGDLALATLPRVQVLPRLAVYCPHALSFDNCIALIAGRCNSGEGNSLTHSLRERSLLLSTQGRLTVQLRTFSRSIIGESDMHSIIALCFKTFASAAEYTYILFQLSRHLKSVNDLSQGDPRLSRQE
jgi:hypothetical protein